MKDVSAELANRICRSAPADHSLGYSGAASIVAEAQRLLRRPSDNHCSVERQYTPAVDRFVISAIDADALLAGFVDPHVKRVAQDFVRPPIVPCWIEVSGVVAWFICAHADTARIKIVCFEPLRKATKTPILPWVVWDWPTPGADIRGAMVFPSTIFDIDDAVAQETLSQCFWLCAALANPRVAVTRRVVAQKQHSRASRALALRRAQQGSPIYSFNRIEVVVPKTCEYRGVIAPTEPLVRHRGHMVVGHWRLIDGSVEPYWVWVDGHSRGDKSLGWVEKERVISVRQAPRRGFVPPPFFGEAGRRVPAMQN